MCHDDMRSHLDPSHNALPLSLQNCSLAHRLCLSIGGIWLRLLDGDQGTTHSVCVQIIDALLLNQWPETWLLKVNDVYILDIQTKL